MIKTKNSALISQFLNSDVFAFCDQSLYATFQDPPYGCVSAKTSKDLDIMSHHDFILGYENGRVGCSVSALTTLRLFLAGKIREKRVSAKLLFWSLAILVLISASVIGFLNLPVLWALLGSIVILTIYILGFFYWVGGAVLSAALASEEFYEFAKAKRALWVYLDDEENLPIRRPRGDRS